VDDSLRAYYTRKLFENGECAQLRSEKRTYRVQKRIAVETAAFDCDTKRSILIHSGEKAPDILALIRQGVAYGSGV